MAETIRLEQVAIVLNHPRYPENIGAAARAAKNMGIREIRVVAPENYDLERIYKMATHTARDLVDGVQLFDALPDALAPFGYVVGTTARVGGQRRLLPPSVIAGKLIPISRDNRVALVFGREDRGLSNEDLRLCHELVTIPTADFSSLNLAQAVMILCYEIFQASTEKKTPFTQRLANRFELDGMYDQLKETLVRINYIQPDNPDYWMNHLRQFFTRMRLRAVEVSIIRGLIRQVNWYAEKRYRDGLADGQAHQPDQNNKERSCV